MNIFTDNIFIKGINKLRKREEKNIAAPDAEPILPNEEKLLMEIRDLLKNN